MKISTLAAGVALSALMITGAVASDLNGSLKDSPSFEAPAVVNWSGFYLGAQGGYGNANHEVSADAKGDGQTFNLIDLDGLNSPGFVGGVYGGADLMRGRFLVGALGGYTLDNMSTEVSIGNGYVKGKLEKNDEWYVGGRAGYLVASKTLAYIGAAYVQTEYEASAKIGGQSVGSLSKTYDGIKAIAGVEYAMGSGFFAKLEYQHDFYGDVTWYDSDCGKITDSLDEDKVLFGISYKIGADRVSF